MAEPNLSQLEDLDKVKTDNNPVTNIQQPIHDVISALPSTQQDQMMTSQDQNVLTQSPYMNTMKYENYQYFSNGQNQSQNIISSGMMTPPQQSSTTVQPIANMQNMQNISQSMDQQHLSMKKPKDKRSNSVYTKDQKEKLRDLYKEHGTSWKMVKYSQETGIKEDYCRRLINSVKKGDDITVKKKRGPPAKCTPELLQEIINEVKNNGKSTREASKTLRVSPSSICRYMKKEETKSLINTMTSCVNPQMMNTIHDPTLSNMTNTSGVCADPLQLLQLTSVTQNRGSSISIDEIASMGGMPGEVTNQRMGQAIKQEDVNPFVSMQPITQDTLRGSGVLEVPSMIPNSNHLLMRDVNTGNPAIMINTMTVPNGMELRNDSNQLDK